METETHGGRLTSALLAENYLYFGENGKPDPIQHLAMYRPLKGRLRLSSRSHRWLISRLRVSRQISRKKMLRLRHSRGSRPSAYHI